MISIIFYFLIFLFGLIVGSFLNCVIYRLENKQSFLKGRSFCPNCKHKLSWLDLIPLFSFIFLKGKCRYCQKKISARYPLIEIATGILFISIFSVFFISPVTDPNLKIEQVCTTWLCISVYNQVVHIAFLLIISCFLIIIFVYDLKHFIIPDKVIFPAIILAFVYQLFRILNFEFVSDFGFRISDLKSLLNLLFSAIISSMFFLTIFLISKGHWIGFGDVKLGFLMGLLLGWPNIIPALFISFLLGAIIGIGLIIAKKKNLKSEVPFGPFLVTGTLISLFFGQRLIEWYFGLFL